MLSFSVIFDFLVLQTRSGYQGMKFLIVILLFLSTACQTNNRSDDEMVSDRKRGAVANRQVGTFDSLPGEYQGRYKGTSFVVWVDTSVSPEGGQQAALLIFDEQDRQRLESHLKNIIDNPAENYRKLCAEVEHNEYGYHFPAFSRIWNTQGGLVLLHDGFENSRLPADWEEIKSQKYSNHLFNEEYIVLGQREYAIRKIRRSSKTGALESVQLTRTGFIQNFFDNPLITLRRVDNPLRTFKLLASYLDSKFKTLQELNQAPTTTPTDLPEFCQRDPA